MSFLFPGFEEAGDGLMYMERFPPCKAFFIKCLSILAFNLQ